MDFRKKKYEKYTMPVTSSLGSDSLPIPIYE